MKRGVVRVIIFVCSLVAILPHHKHPAADVAGKIARRTQRDFNACIAHDFKSFDLEQLQTSRRSGNAALGRFTLTLLANAQP